MTLKTTHSRTIWIGSIVVALIGLSRTSRAAEFESLAPYYDDREATRRGQELGIGAATLEGPTAVEALTFQTLAVVYTAGPAGIAPGGGVHIGMRHVHGWTNPQNGDPKAPGYLSVEIPSGASHSLVIGGEQWFTRYFPWQHIVAVGLPKGLRAGETIRVTYGDKRGLG